VTRPYAGARQQSTTATLALWFPIRCDATHSFM